MPAQLVYTVCVATERVIFVLQRNTSNRYDSASLGRRAITNCTFWIITDAQISISEPSNVPLVKFSFSAALYSIVKKFSMYTMLYMYLEIYIGPFNLKKFNRYESKKNKQFICTQMIQVSTALTFIIRACRWVWINAIEGLVENRDELMKCPWYIVTLSDWH